MNQWIKVSERMPEPEMPVLIFSRNTVSVEVTIGEVRLEDGVVVWYLFETYDERSVTHWMPLPEPPAEVE